MLENNFIAWFKIIACYKVKQITTMCGFMKSFQFDIQRLQVINKSKCLILETVEIYEKLNFV